MQASQTRRALGIFLLAVLSPVAAQAADPAQAIIGTWYGIGQPGAEKMLWLQHNFQDGKFTLEAVICRGAAMERDFSSGRWTFSGTREVITRDMWQGHPVALVDTYDVVFGKGPSMQETMVETNNSPAIMGWVFHSTKVADDFQLPGCDLVS